MAGYKNFLYKSTSERETTKVLGLLKEWGYKYNMELENDYSQYPYFILAKRNEPDMLVFGSNHTVEQAAEAIKKYYPDTDPKIYDIHNLQEFRVRVDLVTGPSYKPRKIERTLETVEYKHFDYDEVIVEIKSPEELNKMFDLISTVVDTITCLKSHIRFFPTYLLISPNETQEDKKCVILIMNNHHRESVEQTIVENKKKYYPRILGLSDWGTLKSMLERGIDSPSYSPRKINRTLESVNYEEKSEIIIQLNNENDIRLITTLLKDNGFFDRVLESDLSELTIFPSYIFLDLKNGDWFLLDRRDNEPTDAFNGYTYKETYEIPYTVKDIMTLTKVLRTKKIIPAEQAPNYMPRRINRTLESVGSKVLYAFDLDDTLVFSKRFEDVIKSLLKESVTPESILNNKMNEIGVERKDLKYEHGRIYFNDPIELFNVTGSQSWVRKDNRVYLLKPDEYLSTPESMPIKTNPVLVDIYNKAENKVIITSRKEKYRTQTIEALKKLGIEMPNYGLNMYPNNSSMSSKVWKAMRLKELQRECGFTEINYFDDNRIVLKKMKEYLKRERIHVNFYKVKENDYRKYDKEL